MISRVSWRKILSFTPFLILFQALVPFVIILTSSRFQQLRWTEITAICIAYGVIATVAIQKFNGRYAHSLGLSSTEQVWRLADAVRTGNLPDDEALRNALPAYLVRRERANAKQLSKHAVFYYSIFGFMFLVSTVTRDWPDIILFSLVLMLGLYAQSCANKSQINIDALKIQLDLHHKRPNEHVEELSELWEQTSSPNKSTVRTRVVIGSILLVGLIALATKTHMANKYQTTARAAQTFASSKYDFKINFPSKPWSNESTSQILSAEKMPPIPYAQYSSLSGDKQEFFEIDAYNWPNQDADFANNTDSDLQTFLKEHVNHDVSAMKGKVIKMIDKTDTLYANSGLSEVAEFSYPQKDGRTVYGFDEVFTVRNFQYDIMAINTDLSTFYWFVGTYKYTGPSDVLMWNQVPNLPPDYYNDGSCSTDNPGCTPTTNSAQPTGVNPQSSNSSNDQPTISISN